MSDGEAKSGPAGLRLILLNSSYQSLGNLYYLLVRGAYIILFARLLGAELYGNYVYAHSWYLLAIAITSWGMNELMISEAARSREQGKRRIIANGLGLRLVLATAGTISVAAAALLFEPDPDLRLLIVLYSQGVLVRGAISWFSALLVMRESSQYWMYIHIVSLTLEVAVAVYLAVNDAGLVPIATSQVLVWWLTLAALWLVYQRQFHAIRPGLSRDVTRFFLSNGTHLAIAALIMSCLGPGLMILCRYFLDRGEELGHVAFVIQLLIVLGQMIRMASNSALPQLNQLSDLRLQRQTFFLSTIWNQAMYLGGIGFALCYLWLPPLVVAIIGGAFESAAMLFSRVSWLLIPLAIMSALRLLLLSERLTRTYLLSIIAGTCALGLQVAILAGLDAFSSARLLTALGITYCIIVLISLAVILQQVIAPEKPNLLLAPLLLVVCIALFIATVTFSSGSLALAAVLPLAIASLIHFKLSYAKISGG